MSSGADEDDRGGAGGDRRGDLASTVGSGVTRTLGLVAAIGVGIAVAAYFSLPDREAAGQVFSLSDVAGPYANAGLLLQALVVVTLGLGVALRPTMGPGVLAAGAVTLPWLLRLPATPFERLEVSGALRLVQVSIVLAALAVLVALIMAGRELRPEPGGLPVSDAGALLVAAVGLAGVVGLDWYRVGDIERSDDLGGLVETATAPGQASWVGLLLALAALGVAVVAGGFVRRVVGAALAFLMASEVLLRLTISWETLYPQVFREQVERSLPPDQLPAVEAIGVRLLVPVLALAGGIWLAAGSRRAPGALGDPSDGSVV